MNYCQHCVSPFSAVDTLFNREGICGACCATSQIANHSSGPFWDERQQQFESIIEQYRCADGSNYDCIIPVSGGKDSYWQAYLMKYEYGMNPLMVTYHGNNFLPEGQANLDRMREQLGLDHLVFGPSVETLQKLNRVGFKKFGDINWHIDSAISIFPLSVAVQQNIPLMIWGESTAGGVNLNPPDEIAQTCFEDEYAWQDLIDENEEIEARDLVWLRPPKQTAVKEIKARKISISDYFNWNPSDQATLMQDKFDFEFARKPFERTYNMMSDLDDMHKNGIQDYMKFIKFGYGRATEHAANDIRAGYITRNEAIQITLRYDHVKPRHDLERWLDYVDMTEQEFDKIADTFRSPDVWWIENGQWYKDNISGEASCYGDVHFSDELDVKKYTRQDAA